MTNKVFAAFFLGAGGALLSPGIVAMANAAHAAGIQTDVFDYHQYGTAAIEIERWRDAKVALIGYSGGCSAVTYMQSPAMNVKCDLLVALAESRLCMNYPIDHGNTKRSILYHGDFPLDFLSTDGEKDGFDVINHTRMIHLGIQLVPSIHAGVLAELGKLQSA